MQLTFNGAEVVRMPGVLASVCSAINSDLYNGPLYLDSEGNEVSWLDDGARQFDFQRACKIVGRWFSRLGSFYIGQESGHVTDRQPEPYYKTGEPCPYCSGTGTANDVDCAACGGTGDEYLDEEPYIEVSPEELARENFGRELAGVVF